MGGKVRRVDFYADEWLTGTRGLTLEQRGLYITACALIYSQGGPIERDRLRQWCGRSFRRVLDSLIQIGKIVVTEDGLLHHERCEKELQTARKRIEKSQINGQNGGRKPNENRPVVEPTRATNTNTNLEDSKTQDVGRSAPAKPPVTTLVRDPIARDKAIAENKFKSVYMAVNRAAARLGGPAQEEAWQVAAIAEKAGSWKTMPEAARKKLHDLYAWVKSLSPEEVAA